MSRVESGSESSTSNGRSFQGSSEGQAPPRPPVRALPDRQASQDMKPRRVVSVHRVRPVGEIDPVTRSGPVSVRHGEPRVKVKVDEPQTDTATSVYVEPPPTVSVLVPQETPVVLRNADNPAMTDEEFLASFEANKQHLYNVGLRMFGNPDDAEDMVQETFANAWRGRASYHNGSHGGWLHTVGTNTGLTVLRHRQRALGLRQPSVEGEVPETGLINIKPEQDPAAIIEANATRDEVKAALGKLLPGFASAVYLADGQGYPYEQIAQMTGTNMGTVRSRIHRGRQYLKKAVEEIRRDEE